VCMVSDVFAHSSYRTYAQSWAPGSFPREISMVPKPLQSTDLPMVAKPAPANAAAAEGLIAICSKPGPFFSDEDTIPLPWDLDETKESSHEPVAVANNGLADDQAIAAPSAAASALIALSSGSNACQ